MFVNIEGTAGRSRGCSLPSRGRREDRGDVRFHRADGGKIEGMAGRSRGCSLPSASGGRSLRLSRSICVPNDLSKNDRKDDTLCRVLCRCSRMLGADKSRTKKAIGLSGYQKGNCGSVRQGGERFQGAATGFYAAIARASSVIARDAPGGGRPPRG